MLHLLWGLLNFGLFLFFALTCFRAVRLVREKFGLVSALFLVFGLFSLVAGATRNTGNREFNSNQVKTWTFASKDSLSKEASFRYSNVKLDETILSTYNLGIEYAREVQNQLPIPIRANSLRIGFSNGTNWVPLSISVARTDDVNRLEYHVTGNVEWRLFGVTVYVQPKRYSGIATVG